MRSASSEPLRKRMRKIVGDVGDGRGSRSTPSLFGLHAQPESHRDQLVGGLGGRHKDERFVDYLSAGFEQKRPLRRERHIERNRKVFAVIVFGLILFWITFRFFIH